MSTIAYNEDCMVGMSQYPDKYFDLAVVDPPYGIFASKKLDAFARQRRKKEGGGGTWATKYSGKAKSWDITPDLEYFEELERISKEQIVWGANHFGFAFDNYIIWRKKTISETFTMSMAEIASVSINGNGKVFECAPQDPTRFHPTQKPIKLYSWIYHHYLSEGGKVIDTHLGSGSNRIAAHKAGNIDFVGYEIDKEYFEAQEKRYMDFISQLVLF